MVRYLWHYYEIKYSIVAHTLNLDLLQTTNRYIIEPTINTCCNKVDSVRFILVYINKNNRQNAHNCTSTSIYHAQDIHISVKFPKNKRSFHQEFAQCSVNGEAFQKNGPLPKDGSIFQKISVAIRNIGQNLKILFPKVLINMKSPGYLRYLLGKR